MQQPFQSAHFSTLWSTPKLQLLLIYPVSHASVQLLSLKNQELLWFSHWLQISLRKKSRACFILQSVIPFISFPCILYGAHVSLSTRHSDHMWCFQWQIMHLPLATTPLTHLLIWRTKSHKETRKPADLQVSQLQLYQKENSITPHHLPLPQPTNHYIWCQ